MDTLATTTETWFMLINKIEELAFSHVFFVEHHSRLSSIVISIFNSRPSNACSEFNLDTGMNDPTDIVKSQSSITARY